MNNKLKIFDSLRNKKVDFTPYDEKNIRIYACGPTVYDYAHIGNARMAVACDILIRILRYIYPKVTYVSNITDIDDKIIQKSKDSNLPINKITEKFHKIYNDEMQKLNVKNPDFQPKATNFIKEMIDAIEKLTKTKNAYLVDGHVLFHVPSYKHYGCLSRRTIEEQIAGNRIDIAPFKKNDSDFVLWKPSKQNEPSWDSPWGKGRPGWHIECSAMSHRYLGANFDIHGGGLDLKFPHHENEIAQSECANNSDFANYWIHVAPLNVDGKKMSKSLGNYLTIRDFLNDYHPEVLKTFFLLTHYRKPINFTNDSIKESKNILDKLYESLKDVKKFNSSEVDKKIIDSFKSALKDDFNTSRALKILQKISQGINSNKSDKEAKEKLTNSLKVLGNLLGILNNSSQDYFQYDSSKKISNEDIELMIKERNQARLNKDFKKADLIREKLFSLNIALEDDGENTIWKKLVQK